MRDFLDTHKKDANSGIIGYTCTQLLPPALSLSLGAHSSFASWLGLQSLRSKSQNYRG